MNIVRRLLIRFQNRRQKVFKTLDTLPLWNWFKIQETESLSYLYESETMHGKEYPAKFEAYYFDMFYSFEKMDLTILELTAKKAYFESIWATNKDARARSEALALQKQIDEETKRIAGAKKTTLNEFVNYIELTFKSIGSIDVKKINTQRAYSLYMAAVEVNEQMKKQNEPNKEN